MNEELGKGALRMALFIIVTAGVLLLFLEPGTAEFYLTAGSLVLGLLFVGVIWIFIRMLSR